MVQYRLLRDNRESGPFSLEDLLALNLKAYDLVWVDGKSMSWKYPSEYEELKPYAPAATEDLYLQLHPPTTPSSTEQRRKTGEKNTQKKFVSIILPTNSPNLKKAAPVSPPAFSENLIPGAEGWEVAEKLHLEWPRKQQRSPIPYIAGVATLLLLAAGIWFFAGKSNSTVADNPVTAPAAIVTYAAASTPVRDIIVITPLEFAVLKKDIAVHPNAYQSGLFGGVTDLQLAVTNQGKTVLRDIVVKLDYLAKDKAIVQSETLQVPYLSAGATHLLKAPDADKGVAVVTRIVAVNGFRSSEPIH